MIILLGMPRSGTTWVGKIFDSHPGTFYCHEPDTAERLSLPLFPPAKDSLVYRGELEAFSTALNGRLKPRVVGKMPLFPKRYRSDLGNRLHAGKIWLSKLAGRGGISWSVAAPPKELGARTVWKSIESLGRAGVIAEALPDAQVILLIRHPCAYIASVLRGEQAHKFTGSDAQSEDYGVFEALLDTETARARKLTLTQLQKSTPEERLAWRWLLVNEKALTETRQRPNCQVVVYEELCEEPAGVGRRLLESCGLDWDPQCAVFLGASTSQSDERYYAVFKDPLKAANRWRQELSQEAVGRIEAVIAGSEAGEIYFGAQPA